MSDHQDEIEAALDESFLEEGDCDGFFVCEDGDPQPEDSPDNEVLSGNIDKKTGNLQLVSGRSALYLNKAEATSLAMALWDFYGPAENEEV